jgi:hypothetical protein
VQAEKQGKQAKAAASSAAKQDAIRLAASMEAVQRANEAKEQAEAADPVSDAQSEEVGPVTYEYTPKRGRGVGQAHAGQTDTRSGRRRTRWALGPTSPNGRGGVGAGRSTKAKTYNDTNELPARVAHKRLVVDDGAHPSGGWESSGDPEDQDGESVGGNEVNKDEEEEEDLVIFHELSVTEC